ncbi:MAG: KilA-N domain-containing protein [Rubritalea sp.]|tara:strand:+ start:280 stop:1137 length:858 start_codon:yes stop_codon:yes gene_type:complete
MAKKNQSILVQGTPVKIQKVGPHDYICLTDMVSGFDGKGALIENWLKNKDTVLFLGIWEQINNPDFNSLEFEGIRNQAGHNSFYLSAKKWITATNAAGLIAKAGRYGGTYAHRDIAFEFGSWLSPEFKLYLIKEFQRLKDDENQRLSLSWNLNRTLSKINYRIHTDAIRENLIPDEVSSAQASFTYASEAELLNVALFACTAKQWREANPDLDGNIRDHSTIEQLLVLANIEAMNAEFIHMELTAKERLFKLNSIAIRQMKSLMANAEFINQLPNTQLNQGESHV